MLASLIRRAIMLLLIRNRSVKAKESAFIQIMLPYLAPYRNDEELPVIMRVLLFILWKTNYKTKLAYVTAGDIVKALGAARSNVDAALSTLTRKGLISKTDGKGRLKHYSLAGGLVRNKNGKLGEW